METDWRVIRDSVKQHILDMYDGTTPENRKILYDLLEFVIDNYDLDDTLYNCVKEDICLNDEEEEPSIQELENQEYEENILKRRSIC